MRTRRRAGVSLVEVLVAAAVVAVLVGLLLGAVQKVRERAAGVRVLNTARQVSVAAHNFATNKGGRLLNVDGGPPNQGMAPLIALGPDFGLTPEQVRNLETASVLRAVGADPTAKPGKAPLGVPASASEADWEEAQSLVSVSFAFNPHLFRDGARLDRSVPDGLSNTTAVVTHYANCLQTKFIPATVRSTSSDEAGNPAPANNPHIHRATFADPWADDDKPVSARTFQHRPAVGDCDCRLPQSLTAGGLTVGLADGSARTVRPDVSPTVFWGAVTPAGGEVVAWDD